MTVKQGVRRKIFQKTVILFCIAAVLGVLCYLASAHNNMPDYNNMHMIYTLASVGLSIAILIYIAFKMRLFHLIFAKEWTGTIIAVRRDIIHSYRAYMGMDEVVLRIQLDNSKKKVKLRLPGNKVGNNVYFVGDRVHRLKGTRYPINLTREAQQHICPICGRDSCYGDECPDCNVQY
ncbi:MAG: hypothetical protein IJY39_07530 [Clostridia bacterium]|nr:hypothetical protein [Clostridia bacterium]